MRGNITRRGTRSWRIKFDVGAADDGKRIIRYETIRGTKKQAEAALAKRLNEIAEGRYVPPTSETVKTWARHWLNNIAPVDRSPLTLARYRTLIEVHIVSVTFRSWNSTAGRLTSSTRAAARKVSDTAAV